MVIEIDEILTNGHEGMLHDHVRNRCYKRAINNAVKEIHARGQPVRVLDIGRKL